MLDLRSRLPEIRPALREMAAVADELATALDANESPGEEVIHLIRHNQQLKARVLGGEYLDASGAASAALDSATTVAILPGGKLGSTLWLLQADSALIDETSQPTGWSDLFFEPSDGFAVIQFA